MALLDKFDFGRQKARPVGQNLEKGRDDQKRLQRRRNFQKASIFVILVLITLAAFPRGEMYQYAIQVGDEWRQETLTAPFDFPIYKAEDVIREERAAVRYTTPPFFAEIPNANERIVAYRDTVAQQLERIFDAYSSYQFNRARGRVAEAEQDSVRYMDMRRSARVKLTSDQWQRLTSYYRQGLPGDVPARNISEPLHQSLIQEAWSVGTQVLNVGVMDVPLDSIHTDEIIIRNERDHVEQVRNKESLFGLNEAYSFAQEQFRQLYPEDVQAANIGVAVFRAMFTPSLRYMRGETMRAWQEREARISPSFGRVDRGDIIIESGERVTPQIRQIINSLERERRERGGQTILWRVTLGQLLLITATYLIFFLYIFILRRAIYEDNRKLLLMAILFGVIVLMYAISVRLPSAPTLGVPVAIAPILLTVMFDSRVGIFGALAMALIGGLLLNLDFEFAYATVFASTLGVFSVRDIKNRGQFFLSPAMVLVGYFVVLGSTTLLFDTPRDVFVSQLILVGVNSILVTLAYPLVWVFERAFDITTDLTLLELSDTNRPLLKDLSLRAPGTFNHTLQVANLAEAAADAIGSNALLTRVGALYHDVGKMLKPEYFVENQRPGDNPHDQLKPRMSALIIASHVKEGLEMGRQYNLPKPILEFIPMHHGTTRIEYFYRKAVEQQKEGEVPVAESEFRYPGPRPASKETGILMLADSVEAASRSLAEPTHKRLETLINMIIQARIADGQLSDTDLTFRDLDTIKETFLSMLLGIYHVRVKYPGQEEEEQKPAEKKSSTPPPIPSLKEDGVWGAKEPQPPPSEAPAAPPESSPEGDGATADEVEDVQAHLDERRSASGGAPPAPETDDPESDS